MKISQNLKKIHDKTFSGKNTISSLILSASQEDYWEKRKRREAISHPVNSLSMEMIKPNVYSWGEMHIFMRKMRERDISR